MQKLPVRVAGYIFIGLVCLSLAVLLLLIVLEFTGLAKQWNAEFVTERQTPLFRTGYYGEVLEHDPYEPFKVMHLHPFYLFSLPWRSEDRARANNPFVSVGENGFRVSPVEDAEATAILLGGSTAFGHFASRDENTLTWLLTERTDYKFVSRSSPGWNSHQELVAAAKFPFPYELSVSLSLSNDIAGYCAEARGGSMPDQPYAFNRLSTYFNDVRDKPLQKADKDVSLFEEYFPESLDLWKNVRRWVLGKEKTVRRRPDVKFCIAAEQDRHARAIANAFLHNQKQMESLAVGRGGRHLVVLQPHYFFYDPQQPMARDFRRRVYDLVLQDPWCATRCLDLSRLPNLPSPILFDGTNAQVAHFVDHVHPTDIGFEAIAEAMIPFLTVPR